jgi:hypothetical protein
MLHRKTAEAIDLLHLFLGLSFTAQRRRGARREQTICEYAITSGKYSA